MDNPILASVLGGLVGGLFTFLGVLVTIIYQKRKDARDEAYRQKEKEEELIKARPRLEIQKHIQSAWDLLPEVDLEVFVAKIHKFTDEDRARFHYNPDIIDKVNWFSVDYVLKNIGATEIDHLYLVSNLTKNTALFNVSTDEYLIDYHNQFLNYSAILDTPIKPQQTVRLRISYLSSECIVSNIPSAAISIWLMDTNNNVWTQELFAPYNKLYNSQKSSLKMFRECSDTQTAIQCFRNPQLW